LNIIITLTDGKSDYDLKFKLLDISIAQRWVKHLNLFIQAGQPWDDNKRFYNFPNTQFTEEVVAARLKELITTIKNYDPSVVKKDIGANITQDDLNYFHHIFETCHGLYDAQHTNTFFQNAPVEVQNALGDLNIWIHRYESLGQIPRFVATWKYKPYRDSILDDEFEFFNLSEEWGDLRLNYCEIGKTLFDLWNDNDQYICPEAFKPLHYFCFDFTVRFTDKSKEDFAEMEEKIWQYFDKNQDFFREQGYEKYDTKLSLGAITIAKLIQTADKEKIIKEISDHQQFKSIRIE